MVINAINCAAVQNTAKGRVEDFTNLSSKEVLYLAHNKALCDEQTRKRQNVTRTLIKAVPIVDSMLAVSKKPNALGIAGIGSLTASLGTFAGRLTSWGVLIAAFDITSKLIDKVTNKSKTLSDLKEKHPLAKSLVDLAVIFGVYSNGKKALNTAVKSIPDSIKNKGLNKLNSLKNAIDSSKISKRIYEPLMDKISKSGTNHPKIMGNAKKLQPLIIPAMIIGSLFKTAIIDPLVFSNKVKNNYVEIKTQQEGIKTIMDISNQKL